MNEYFCRMGMKLSEVTAGKTVIVKSIVNDEIFLKLMEMGCVPGEKIMVDQIAPLGDPISIRIAGYHLSLRINEAENILVEEVL
jgi:ferrous iron transport protein A